jgi:hypothetical protein
MALNPQNSQHAIQIQAGILGRNAGHRFEVDLTDRLNNLPLPFVPVAIQNLENHLFIQSPEISLLNYICSREKLSNVEKITAISTGVLATSEDGRRWLNVNGVQVSRCKSDVILTLQTRQKEITIGISTKQCNNKTPTNAQLYFTTARGFMNLLRENSFEISQNVENALRQFCGDEGFRPLDFPEMLVGRTSDPRRFFWEEINKIGRIELENLFAVNQDEITRLLLQKAYLNDPFVPEYVLHKTKRANSWQQTEIAIYEVEELIELSRDYSGFQLKPYSVRKGSYKDAVGITHLAPRFGIVQMQRGGQLQHPTQLQFNLEAGYFYKI